MNVLDDTRTGMLRIERLNLTLSAGAVAASFAFSSPVFAGSVAAGALLEALNFRTLHSAARRFFAGELGGSGLWLGVVGLRLGLLGAAIVFAVTAGAHPLALVIGLSMVMPAVCIDAWRNRPEVIDQSDYPVLPPDDPAWESFSVWRFSAMDEAAAGLEDQVEAQIEAQVEAQGELQHETRFPTRSKTEQ